MYQSLHMLKTTAQKQEKNEDVNDRNLDSFQAGELWPECRTNPPVDLNNKQFCLVTYSLVTVFQQWLQLLQQRLH